MDHLVADANADERLFRAARADLDRLMTHDAVYLREPPNTEESCPSALSIRGIVPRQLLDTPMSDLRAASRQPKTCH